MNKMTYLTPLLVAISLVAGCSSNDSDKDDQGALKSVREGFFWLTDDGEGIYDPDTVSGYAQLLVTENTSTVAVYIQGLNISTEYAAHVHTDVCSNGGGGHYLHEGEEDVAENGLWPTITVDESGVGIGSASNDFVVRADAKSVVIHEPESKERIACVDLDSVQVKTEEFGITQDGTDLGYELIEGSAFLSINGAGESRAEVYVDGLTEGWTFKAHVHTDDCNSGGGGHYLQELDGEDEASNGLWPFVDVNQYNAGTGLASNPFVVRPDDANSVVIHQIDSGERIACSDLDSGLASFRSGAFELTEDFSSLDNFKGRAYLTISEAGVSFVKVMISGLWPNPDYLDYKAHVHNGSCETGGGGHYLQDLDGEDNKNNGLYPGFTLDENGSAVGTASNRFIVRPDARSVVIHDSETGDRMACADLLL